MSEKKLICLSLAAGMVAAQVLVGFSQEETVEKTGKAVYEARFDSSSEDEFSRSFYAAGDAEGVLTVFKVGQTPAADQTAARTAIVILSILDGPPIHAVPVLLNPKAAAGRESSWDLLSFLIEAAEKGKFSLKPAPGSRIQVQLLASGGEFAGVTMSGEWSKKPLPKPE